MKKSLLLSFLFGTLLSVSCGPHIATKVNSNSNSKESTPKFTFMPENDLWMEDNFVDNGMTEEMFNDVIDRVESVYASIISERGATLVIERNWDDSTVNAYAYQEGNEWHVAMFGGLARREEVTKDGFAMVVCHELGHHLGGYPIKSWAAIEGQSDYFAIHACANNLWRNEDNNVFETTTDSYAKELCNKYYSSDAEINLCYREMNAGYSLALLLGNLGGTSVNFSTPDTTIVSRTQTSHPKAQCRLDTYVSAAICSKSWDDAIIPTTASESAKYLCTSNSSKDYDLRARPRCWFKP